MRATKNVQLPANVLHEEIVRNAVHAVGHHRTVGYRVVGGDARLGTVVYELEGPRNHVHLVYTYGVENRLW